MQLGSLSHPRGCHKVSAGAAVSSGGSAGGGSISELGGFVLTG